jgi:hypothetical protein
VLEDNAHVNSISTRNTPISNVLLIFYCSTENNNCLVLFLLYSHFLFSYLHTISIHRYCSLHMEHLLFFPIVLHMGYLLFSTVYSPHCKWVSPHRTLPTYRCVSCIPYLPFNLTSNSPHLQWVILASLDTRTFKIFPAPPLRCSL